MYLFLDLFCAQGKSMALYLPWYAGKCLRTRFSGFLTFLRSALCVSVLLLCSLGCSNYLLEKGGGVHLKYIVKEEW